MDKQFIRAILQRDQDDPNAVVNIIQEWVESTFNVLFEDKNRPYLVTQIEKEQYDAAKFQVKVHLISKVLDLFGTGVINQDEYLAAHNMLLNLN